MKTHSSYMALLAAAVLSATAIPAMADTSFDATADFSILGGNPNGVWSYGWMPNDFSAFNLYTNSGNNGGGSGGTPYWDITGVTAPIIWRNLTTGDLYGAPVGWLSLEAETGQTSVLRWTAPSGGEFQVVGQFLPGDFVTETVAVRRNNNPWWTASDQGTFDLQTTVAAGDTIDFAVTGSSYGGNTPVEVTINLVPEPSSLALLGAGLMFVMRRRRARAA